MSDEENCPIFTAFVQRLSDESWVPTRALAEVIAEVGKVSIDRHEIRARAFLCADVVGRAAVLTPSCAARWVPLSAKLRRFEPVVDASSSYGVRTVIEEIRAAARNAVVYGPTSLGRASADTTGGTSQGVFELSSLAVDLFSAAVDGAFPSVAALTLDMLHGSPWVAVSMLGRFAKSPCAIELAAACHVHAEWPRIEQRVLEHCRRERRIEALEAWARLPEGRPGPGIDDHRDWAQIAYGESYLLAFEREVIGWARDEGWELRGS